MPAAPALHMTNYILIHLSPFAYTAYTHIRSGFQNIYFYFFLRPVIFNGIYFGFRAANRSREFVEFFFFLSLRIFHFARAQSIHNL